MSNQNFDYDNLNISQIKKVFSETSAVKISRLFSKELCLRTLEYITDNEQEIIKNYSSDKRGLVVENVNKIPLIKYFDKPFQINFHLFNKFLTSKLFNLSSELLEDDVYLDRAEVHSRFALGTPIPPHQDNAYFGLKDGKSLTFYISLNQQDSKNGGLRYYRVPSGVTYEHKASDKPGFSLTLSDDYYRKLDVFDPKYECGDCSIHHSTSIHYADSVPIKSNRVIVLRLAIHSLKDRIKDGHEKWYNEMVERNRNILKKLNLLLKLCLVTNLLEKKKRMPL